MGRPRKPIDEHQINPIKTYLDYELDTWFRVYARETRRSHSDLIRSALLELKRKEEREQNNQAA